MLPITPVQNTPRPIPIPPSQINFQVPPVPPYQLPPANNPAIFTKFLFADGNKNAPSQAQVQQVDQKLTSLPPPMFPPPKINQVYQTAAGLSGVSTPGSEGKPIEVQNQPVHLPVLNNQPFQSNFNLMPG